ncbi:MAG TPA: ABC transporter substrate-binding protein [Actinomycetota bacterium]|nr:ABC transporter substrate-binding protein [Actinomycetota bacterium]
MFHGFVGGLAAVLLLLASCGESAMPPAVPASPSSAGGVVYPLMLDTPNGPLTIEDRPQRIVSLSPTATEMLFEIGAGDQVVAVDDQSNYPEGVPTTDLSGYEPNVEAIASYEPDLVVYATEPGDLGSSLEGLGIPALLQPAAATLEEAYGQIEQLGEVTDHVAEATDVVAEMRTDIDAIVATVSGDEGLTFYHELDDTYYSVTSSTFTGQLYEMVGLVNIADEAKGAGGGYPQLSAEYIIDADPDLIFLADTKCCGQSPSTVSRRPGWAGISAVERGDVIPLEEDVAQRWGPRVVEFLERIAGAVDEAKAAAA